MPVVPLPVLLDEARRQRYAVGYFESWDVYSLEAVVAAAELERSPVVIGIGGLSANHEWLRGRGVDLYGGVAASLAARATVPMAILFNEADSFVEASGALRAGYNSVMMHTQGWPWERLVAETSALVAASHALGVAVEGEVGALAEMRDGTLDSSGSQLTTPEQANAFVAATDVDCLAVAVGNVHFVRDDFLPQLQPDLVRELDAAVKVPLVLHGGSGVPADQLRAAIQAGIAKVNFGTRLKRTFGAALQRRLASSTPDPNLAYGSRLPGDVLLEAAGDLTQDVRSLMQTLNSSGKA